MFLNFKDKYENDNVGDTIIKIMFNVCPFWRELKAEYRCKEVAKNGMRKIVRKRITINLYVRIMRRS